MLTPRTRFLAVCASLAALSASALVAQRPPANPVSTRHPAIEYATRPVTDAVALLNQRILNGESPLTFEPGQGYLKSVLRALQIPVESQMLVYSETSLQSEHITQKTPRALYFNDTASVGWVQGADTLELAAWDPQQGMQFYQVDQKPAERPHFNRMQRCLECHEGNLTSGISGMLTMSMLPLSDDPNEYAQGWAVDQKTPYEDRWGGWFVTGAAVPARHLGNVPVYHVKKGGVRAAVAPKLASASGAADTAAYLSGYSDVVALLVFNHQTSMTNLITRLNWETRVQDWDRLHPPAPVRQASRQDDRDPVAATAAELVDHLLFIDEVPLPSKVQGSSGFAEAFAAVGPKDAKGRSLREFDLAKRLMKYPCSYLIYAPAFDALPARAKTLVYERLWTVLSGKDADPAYRRLTAADRQAIIEILRETKPGLPDVFRQG
jgi:hypothetical protein